MVMARHTALLFHVLRQLRFRAYRAIAIASLFLVFATGATYAAQDCGNGVELRLSSPVASQGTLLLAEVHSLSPLSDAKGEWDSRTAPFWQSGSNGKIWRALLGADLEKPTGEYDFKVTAQAAGGDPVTCSASIAVKAGHFPTENLHVENKFVEPDPEQLARAKEEAQRLREIFDRVTPERLWQGRFRLPLSGVTAGSNFGRRRILNGQPSSPHTGVDFPSPAGTPVHAAQRGRVLLAESLYFPGNTVILDHGLGVYTLYGHLSEISVKVGDVVQPGAVLGKVGATGRVTGPHLHWGLTVNKARVNALQIVKLLPN